MKPNDIDEMSFDALVPSESKYLAKHDVGEDGVILTIKGFKTELIEGDNGYEEKVVLYFNEPEYKPMIVNRTNSQLIGIATAAPNAGAAKGKQILVFNDPSVSFGGKVTGGIRIKKVPGAPKSANLPDDDIPF